MVRGAVTRLTWQEGAGLVVTLSANGLRDDELLTMANRLTPVPRAAWAEHAASATALGSVHQTATTEPASTGG